MAAAQAHLAALQQEAMRVQLAAAAQAQAAQMAAAQAAQAQLAALQAVKVEVTFNTAPAKARFYLTKRSSQQELEAKWRVVVVVKGRFYAPGALPPSEKEEDRPLFMRITPGKGLPQVRPPLSVLAGIGVGLLECVIQPGGLPCCCRCQLETR
jgi:hypothetical protein